MEFFDPKEMIKTGSNFNFFGGEAFAFFLMHLLRMKKVNKLYSELSMEKGIDFIDKLLETLEIKFEISEENLKKIPVNGGLITISNHPFGGLDGILLIKILSTVRPDIKILANSLLKRIDPLKDFFLSENHSDEKNMISHRQDLKLAIEYLKEGNVLGVFPSGEVSGFDQFYNVSDKEWQLPVIKMIKNSGSTVIPVYFSGSNSSLFNILGIIDPQLMNIKLPTEFFNKKNQVINIRIGSPIRPNEISQFSDIHQLGRFLRAKTYSLGASKNLEIKRFFSIPKFKKKIKADEIIPAIEQSVLLFEIENIKTDYLLFTIKNYSVFCAPTKYIPNILTEIGRLREITFRLVGEGTNRSIDLDEFDLYYNQLFIWDNDEKCIVGAYRIGLGNEIIQQFGFNGFYIKSLFRIKKGMGGILNQSLELGRSFVVQEYQRKPLPLFLLWKGILYYLLKNPLYRYLIGPVSISNNYSPVSKDSIIRFIVTNYFDKEKARNIRPRKAYMFISENPDINLLLENAGNDLNKFDRLIGDIDMVNDGIPVLLKKYLSLNARILSFNVDPNFNNCLDGLILLDIFNVPQKTIESLSKEVNDGSILERFYSSREIYKMDEPVRI
jgi:putative hemolysin